MSVTTETLRITTLVENTAGRPGLLAEHGFALWLELGPHRVLFDTGAGEALFANAERLGIDLAAAEAIFLSHGHYDHTGGLGQMLQIAPHATVFAHPDAFVPKFACMKDGTSRAIGMPSLNEEMVRAQAGKLVLERGPLEITPGLTGTGEVPRVTTFEDTGGPFFADPGCMQPDPLTDDQSLFFESSKGTVVILGCAHSGVINTLMYIRELTDGRPIHAVLGGMHLGAASPERMEETIRALGEFDVECLAPAHCTGMAASVALWNAFPEKCFPCAAGTFCEY